MSLPTAAPEFASGIPSAPLPNPLGDAVTVVVQLSSTAVCIKTTAPTSKATRIPRPGSMRATALFRGSELSASRVLTTGGSNDRLRRVPAHALTFRAIDDA